MAKSIAGTEQHRGYQHQHTRNIVVNTMESIKKLSLGGCTHTLGAGVLVGWLVTMTGFEACFGKEEQSYLCTSK